MDVVQYKEEYQVELIGGTNNKSIPFTCRAAWIGKVHYLLDIIKNHPLGGAPKFLIN